MGLNKKFEGQGSRFSKVTSPKIQRLERNINVGGLGYNPRNFEVVKNSSPNIGPTPISYTFDTKVELQTGVNLWISDNAAALENYGDINTWTFAPAITDMSDLFNGKITFNSDISNWDISNVTDMRGMFASSFMFNQDISSWNVGNVTDMSYMFYNTVAFNQNIGTWDVSSVTNMTGMFALSFFNQNLTGWCVTNIPSEPTQFSFSSALTDLNKPVWGTCPP